MHRIALMSALLTAALVACDTVGEGAALDPPGDRPPDPPNASTVQPAPPITIEPEIEPEAGDQRDSPAGDRVGPRAETPLPPPLSDLPPRDGPATIDRAMPPLQTPEDLTRYQGRPIDRSPYTTELNEPPIVPPAPRP